MESLKQLLEGEKSAFPVIEKIKKQLFCLKGENIELYVKQQSRTSKCAQICNDRLKLTDVKALSLYSLLIVMYFMPHSCHVGFIVITSF